MSTVVELTHGRYLARLDELRAAMRSVRHDGRELLFRVDGAVPTPPYAGLVLAPWPNRIADGRYVFDGQVHQLPINEVERGHALHGLTLWERWVPTEISPVAATFTHTVHARPGYPFTIGLAARYDLDDRGLTLTLTATNLGDTDAPIGLSTHPYLMTGDDRLLDDWTLTLPCADVLKTDDRLIPMEKVPADSVGVDFRSPRGLGDTVLDHAFIPTNLGQPGAARLTGPDGSGVELTWDASCGWVQVYTLHRPGEPMHRRAVAIEPMTCAPDAFNSGDGLIRLAPGARTQMTCTIAAIEPSARE